jgi:hypothetical protein
MIKEMRGQKNGGANNAGGIMTNSIAAELAN